MARTKSSDDLRVGEGVPGGGEDQQWLRWCSKFGLNVHGRAGKGGFAALGKI